MFNLGRIRFFTDSGGFSHHSTGQHGTMANGMMVHCIADVKEQYQIIKKLIDEGSEE